MDSLSKEILGEYETYSSETLKGILEARLRLGRVESRGLTNDWVINRMKELKAMKLIDPTGDY